MELPIEYDPHFGSKGDESLLSDQWVKAAKQNVNDEPHLRADRISSLRKELEANKIELCPGDGHQMLQILRAANCDVKGALEVAKTFLSYQKYCDKGLLYNFALQIIN